MLRADNFENINKRSLKNVQKMFQLVRKASSGKSEQSAGGKSNVAEQHRPWHYRSIESAATIGKGDRRWKFEFVKNWISTPGNHIDSRFSDGQSILHKAALWGNANIFGLALKEGADSLSGDLEMNTPSSLGLPWLAMHSLSKF